MPKIYTTVWKKNGIYKSEGICGQSLEEVIEFYNDYSYAWKKDGYEYHITYVEDIASHLVEAIDITLIDISEV